MAYPSFAPEAISAMQILLYCIACICGGAALTALGVYIVLVGSEILFSEWAANGRRAKALQESHPPMEARVEITAIQRPAVAGAGHPDGDAIRQPGFQVGTEIPAVPVTLEGDSAGF